MTLHGKEAGIEKIGGAPLNRSAAEVNALDDRSVQRTALSNPLKNAGHIPELYPDLDSQANKLVNDFGYDNLHIVSYSNGGAKHLYLNRTKGIAGTSFDPFLGPRQARDIARGTKAPFKLITTDNLSVSDPEGVVEG